MDASSQNPNQTTGQTTGQTAGQSSGQATGAELRQELRNDAQNLTGTAKDKIYSQADASKGAAAEQAKSLSSALGSAADQMSDSPQWLRSAFQQTAQTIQRFADTIEQKDSRELTRDVQQLARDNPGSFLTACALAGFAAARVLKAGTDGATGGSSTSGQSGSSTYDPYQADAGSTPAFAGMGGGTYQGAAV